ncbi:MAG TPA: SAM-dependent methyltransferase [Actinospica sp.]|nr:SAM-dependent methyltransferase [Actinospica sp.]
MTDESTPWDLELGVGWQPPEPPSEQPHPMRIWDYIVGGKDNFQNDRDAAKSLISVAPDVVLAARAGEAFSIRAQRFLAAPEHGITQFLHLGAFIPRLNSPYLDELERIARPGSRHVFVTDDPVSAAHVRAGLASRMRARTRIHALLGDFREPAPLLADPRMAELIDLSRPVGMLLFGMLTFIADDDRLAEIPAQLHKALAPGSMIAMAHFLGSADQSANVEALRLSLGENPYRFKPRSLDRLRRLLADFDFVEPGFVRCTSWRPDGRGPGQELEERCAVAGGVALVH